MLNVEGKSALVTGGSLGIGRATVRIFAGKGIRTFFTYRTHREEAEELAKETGAVPILADLSSTEGALAAAREFLASAASADILVHNAGIWTYGEMGAMDRLTWRETMSLNLDSVYVLTNAIVPAMKTQGSGAIVLVSSTAARRGEALHSHYAASKGALHSLAKSLATELGPSGIRTNVVAPGWVDTPMSAAELSIPGRREAIAKIIPLRRIPPPDDIAYPILFLVSDWSRHVNGAVLDVNGGSVLID
jgi:3-oxoacyl-[acyl-carrier protein] reductase